MLARQSGQFDVHVRARDAFFGKLHTDSRRFDGKDPSYFSWIVGNVQTRTKSDFDDVAGKSRAHASSHLTCSLSLHDLVLKSRQNLFSVDAHEYLPSFQLGFREELNAKGVRTPGGYSHSVQDRRRTSRHSPGYKTSSRHLRTIDVRRPTWDCRSCHRRGHLRCLFQ